jgi:hypothetical protein
MWMRWCWRAWRRIRRCARKRARDLLRRLDALALDKPWNDARAIDWWKAHLPSTSPL